MPLLLRRPRLLAAAAGVCLALSGAPAWAAIDMWGWVDSYGTAHFAREQVDARYKLLFTFREEFDSAEIAAAPSQPDEAPTVSLQRMRGLIASSPAVKAVGAHLRTAASAAGLDIELLQALIAAESGFDAAAVSSRGAVGLMQLLPTTARQYGVIDGEQQPIARKLMDPAVNIRAGTRHLRYLVDLFPGQLELALAAYNAGEGAVQRAGNRIPNYPETQNYVKTVMQLYRALKPVEALLPATPRRVQMTLPAGAPASVPTAEFPKR